MQRSTSIYGSSSALRGVQLKLGDKFKPPAKITLPVGWKTRDPSRILNLTYDFSLEEQVIKKVTAEKQAREQEENAQKAKELMKAQPATPVIANMGGDILQPTHVAAPVDSNSQKKNKESINFKDFEGDSDNPFETVELQSIDNMDALKSVLQPDLKSDTPPTTVANGVTNAQVQDAASDNTRILHGQSNIGDSQVATSTGNPFTSVAGLPPVGVPTDATCTHSTTDPSVTKGFPLYFPNNCDPMQTQLNTGTNTRDNLFGVKESRPSGLPVDTGMMQISGMNNIVSQEQNNSTPSGASLETRKISFPGAMRVLPAGPGKPMPRRPRSMGDELHKMGSVLNEEAAGTSHSNQKRPVPKPRSKLPPLRNNIDTSPSSIPPPLPPKKSKLKRQGYKDMPKLAVMEDNHLKCYSSPLPPISPPPPNDPPAPDPRSSMAPEEVKFVNNLASMGFPLARAARAVKSLGCKEREVVEFLISVNDICSLGYSEDQVEMVLKESGADQKKAVEFLNLITQFKELGFQEEKIFDALKKSECDSNKTLDILTCAG